MDWQTTFDRESPALFHDLLSKGCPPDLAEDVIQEVFLSAMSAGAEPEHLRAYLFSAARRALALWRHRMLPAAELPETFVEPEERGGDPEAIHAALARLPVEQREVVVLHVWHEMSFREIGQVLEISPDTAASRWRYGIGKLKGML